MYAQLLKRKYTYKAFIVSRLSPAALQTTHLTPSILGFLKILAVCVLNSATAYVYIDCVVWCGRIKVALSDNRS